MKRPIAEIMRAVASAAASVVGAKPSTVHGWVQRFGTGISDHYVAVELYARASAWRASARVTGLHGRGVDLDALRALRERTQHQRDRRVRMLAADDAALRVIDEAIAEETRT